MIKLRHPALEIVRPRLPTVRPPCAPGLPRRNRLPEIPEIPEIGQKFCGAISAGGRKEQKRLAEIAGNAEIPRQMVGAGTRECAECYASTPKPARWIALVMAARSAPSGRRISPLLRSTEIGAVPAPVAARVTAFTQPSQSMPVTLRMSS
jgi:hypothetical protein